MTDDMILTEYGLFTRQNRPVARLRCNGYLAGLPGKDVAGFYLFTDVGETGSTFAVATSDRTRPRAAAVYEKLMEMRGRFRLEAVLLETEARF